MYEASLYSNESSEYELNAETLDQLYKEQLQMLRELVFKQSHTHDIELCRKWLKIFSKTSKGEKMARNCLCSLMQQQLQEQGVLSEPFTNLQNGNRDLERVLLELDEQSYISANYMQRTQRSSSTYVSHDQDNQCKHNHCRPKQRLNHQMNSNTPQARQSWYENDGGGDCADVGGDRTNVGLKANYNYDNEFLNKQGVYAENQNDDRAGGDTIKLDELSTECEENEKLTENLLLRRELETLRLQFTEKEIENIRLKELAEKYQMENSNYQNALEGLHNNLLQSVKLALQHWSADEQPTFPMKLFELLFKDFETNLDFFQSIKRCDVEFGHIMAKRFENELCKRKAKMASHISRKMVKGKKRIQEKYEQRLRMQNWAQRLQLKLVKLKCFSALRQIFINAQLDKDETGMNNRMWELLRNLEEKYQAIVNEII
uniref:Uncharacterized protein n=1 Tax=Ceratitis capitata TaxID=7213 RepID=W8AAG4_CERCA